MLPVWGAPKVAAAACGAPPGCEAPSAVVLKAGRLVLPPAAPPPPVPKAKPPGCGPPAGCGADAPEPPAPNAGALAFVDEPKLKDSGTGAEGACAALLPKPPKGAGVVPKAGAELPPNAGAEAAPPPKDGAEVLKAGAEAPPNAGAKPPLPNAGAETMAPKAGAEDAPNAKAPGAAAEPAVALLVAAAEDAAPPNGVDGAVWLTKEKPAPWVDPNVAKELAAGCDGVASGAARLPELAPLPPSTLVMDMLEAAPRLFCRCRPPFSAGASSAGVAAPPNENAGAEAGSAEGVAAPPLPPTAGAAPAPNANDGAADMEGVGAALPPASVDAGAAVPKEKLSGAGPDDAAVAAADGAASAA